MRAIRAASIVHNDDDYRNPNARRVKLSLRKAGTGYRWYDDDDQDTDVGGLSVAEAMENLRLSWGSDVWDLRIGGRL